MDPSLHSGIKLAVSWVDSSRWKPSKVTKDTNISRQGFGLRILACASYFHWLSWERKNHQEQISYTLLVLLKEEITQKQPTMRKKKCSFIKTMHHVTSQSQRWQNYMNCSSNCFHTKLILQIWPQWLIAVCRPQKNAPEKEIWLPWRSDIRNWGVFWGQRQIILQKKASSC